MGKAWTDLTDAEKNALRGNLVLGTDAIAGDPPDDLIFPIVCGPWPNAHDHAIRVECACCTKPAGVSPIGHALHERNTRRDYICYGCHEGLRLLTEMLGL